MRKFESGAVRDSNEGKPRPDLISAQFKLRLGQHLALGAKHYGENNWQKGMSNEVLRESLERHLLAYDLGKTDEDHLSAAAFNLMALIHFDELNSQEGANKKRVFKDESVLPTHNQKATLFKPEDVPDSNRDIELFFDDSWFNGCYLVEVDKYYFYAAPSKMEIEKHRFMFWRELKSNK